MSLCVQWNFILNENHCKCCKKSLTDFLGFLTDISFDGKWGRVASYTPLLDHVLLRYLSVREIHWAKNSRKFLPFSASEVVHGSGCGEYHSHFLSLWSHAVTSHSSGSKTWRRSGCARRCSQLPDHCWNNTSPHGEMTYYVFAIENNYIFSKWRCFWSHFNHQKRPLYSLVGTGTFFCENKK